MKTLGRAKLVKRFRGCLGWYHAECAQVMSTVTSHQDDSLRCTEQVVDDADICLPVKLHMIKFLNFFSFRIVATSFLGYLPHGNLSRGKVGHTPSFQVSAQEERTESRSTWDPVGGIQSRETTNHLMGICHRMPP